MKIVVIDHVYLEDRHIEKLRSVGDLEIFKEPPKTTDELKQRIADAEVVIVGWTNLTRDAINSAKKLKMIAIWATTCHYADLEAAKEKGILVTHVPGYATESVAEYAIALLLAAVRKVTRADRHVREGKFDYRPFGGRELAGKTLGLIGTGAIGCRVAEIARALKMQVVGYDKYPNLKKAEEIGFKYADLDSLLKQSDVVSIHVTLNPETEKLIGKKEIAMMKTGAVIINTSQGKVIDEKVMLEALESGKLCCAGLDVFEEEPPLKSNLLFALENTVLSPHIGFNTGEAEVRCSDICVDNIVKFIGRKEQNVC
jgi:phosphoglycerate dehydrogenase-like enzyme